MQYSTLQPSTTKSMTTHYLYLIQYERKKYVCAYAFRMNKMNSLNKHFVNIPLMI